MHKERLLLGESSFKIISLEHPRDAEVRGDLDQFANAYVIHPFAVESQFSLMRIKNFEDLPLVGLRVAFHLITGQGLTQLRATRDEVERNAETYKRQVFKILDPHQ